MDITPLMPEGRQIIEGYGAGMFRVAGTVWHGSVLVFPDVSLAWPVAALDAVSLESLQPVIEARTETDVLLLGCGARMQLPPPEIRAILRRYGIGIEPMDTGAACRTFNVLLAEGRRVVAALIAL